MPHRPHRIAAGAIVIRDDRILLVRYRDATGGTYLVAPGGGVLDDESVAEAAVRETLEETGVRVAPGHVLLIEDLLTPTFKMCKVWLGGTVVTGNVRPTQGARLEGIAESRWFSRAELDRETVLPVDHHGADVALVLRPAPTPDARGAPISRRACPPGR